MAKRERINCEKCHSFLHTTEHCKKAKKGAGNKMVSKRLLKDVCTLRHKDFLKKYFGKAKKEAGK